MYPAQDHRKQISTRRRIAGVVAFTFLAVLFGLPLYAALTLCAMPCCDHPSGEETAVSAAMTACQQTCAISSDEAAPPKAVTFAPEQRAHHGIVVPGIAMTFEPPAAPARSEERSDSHHRAAIAPLHVLNSIFRI